MQWIAMTFVVLTCLPVYAQDRDEPMPPLTASERETLAEYERQEARFQRIALRDIAALILDLKRDMRGVRRDRSLSRAEREREAESIQSFIDDLEEYEDEIRNGDAAWRPYFDFDRLERGQFGWIDNGRSLNQQHAFARDSLPFRPLNADREEMDCWIEFAAPPHPDGAFYEVARIRRDERGRQIYVLVAVDIYGLMDRRDAERPEGAGN